MIILNDFTNENRERLPSGKRLWYWHRWRQNEGTCRCKSVVSNEAPSLLLRRSFWCGRSHPKAWAFRNFNAFRMPHRHRVVLLLITWHAWKFTYGAEDRRGSTDFAPKQAALTGDWSSVLSPDTFHPAKWVISKTRPTPMVTSTDSVFPVSRQSAPLMNLEIPL